VPYVIAGNAVCQVTVRSRLFNQVVMNTFMYRLDSAGGVVADGAAFLSDFHDELAGAGQLYELLLDCYSPQVTLINADLQWIDIDRFRKRTFVVGPQGSAGWISTTANLAATVELSGDVADKRGRGVKHIPGLGGTAVVSGLLDPAVVATLEDFALGATLPVTVGTRTMTPIVFGRARPSYVNKHGVTVPAIPKAYRIITNFAVPSTVRVMRRRTVGGGI